MQILKKRNSTETFHDHSDNGITNYNTWLGNFFEKKTSSDFEVGTIFDNMTHRDRIENPYNLEWTYESTGVWGGSDTTNSFMWLYHFNFNAPVSANYMFMTSTHKCWDDITDKFLTLDFRFLTAGQEVPALHRRDQGHISTFYWNDNAYLKEGELCRGLMYVMYPYAEEDSVNPPFTSDILINGTNGTRDKSLGIGISYKMMH